MDEQTISTHVLGTDPMPFRLSLRSRFTNRMLLLSTIIIGASILLTTPTYAQWRTIPSLAVGLEYDDNPRLNIDSIVHPSVWGYGLDADARISYSSQQTEFWMIPRYLGIRYDGYSELDSNSWFLNMNLVHTGLLSTFRLRGDFGDEPIRTAERSDIDFGVDNPDDIPNDDSARALETENRQRIYVAPDWSYQIGQRSLIRLGAGYLDVDYDEISSTSLADFRDARGLASFEHEWSPRNSIIFNGYYRENKFEGSNGDYSGYGLTLGFTRTVTENSRFVLNGGIDTTEDSSGNEQTNPIGELSFVRRLQTSTLLAAYQRAVSGTGDGVMSVRDTISLHLSKDLSNRFSVGAGVRAYQTRALDKNTVNFDEREYIQFRALFSYGFSKVFSVDIDYRYTKIDRDISPSNASSNLVNLWFRYRAVR